MSTINRVCQLQGWSDAKVVRLAVEYLESEGLLHDFLNWLSAVAEQENEDHYDGQSCTSCNSAIDSHGFCTNPGCDYYGFFETEPAGLHPAAEDASQHDSLRPEDQGRAVRVQTLRKYEDGCAVANTRSKAYRVPGDRTYSEAKKAKCVVFFKSGEAAEAAGYHRASP